jgi:hypothetical protein
MRKFVFAVMLLIIAPVYAAEYVDNAKDFLAFMEKFQDFSKKRKDQEKENHANFYGAFKFREECRPFDDNLTPCMCPLGNNYAQCLESAIAMIGIDPNDVGGRGYFQVSASGYALNNDGRWVPSTERNVFSYMVENIGRQLKLNIPIPSDIDKICVGNPNENISVVVGYGAVMPQEIEFANLMKARSESLGYAYNSDKYILQRARVNAMRSSKYATIGSFPCWKNPMAAGNGSSGP